MMEREDVLKIEDVQELKNLSKKFKKKEIIYAIACALVFGLGWAAWINTCISRHLNVINIIIMFLSYGGSLYTAGYVGDYSNLKDTANNRIKELTKDR